MNRKNIIRLAELLEANAPPKGITEFNMETYSSPIWDEPATHVRAPKTWTFRWPPFLRSPCGTAACIAGWAAALYAQDHNLRGALWTSMLLYRAELFLGVDMVEDEDGFSPADDLFVPWAAEPSGWLDDWEPGSITPQHAAAVLRRFAATGKVDWSKPEEPSQVSVRTTVPVREFEPA